MGSESHEDQGLLLITDPSAEFHVAVFFAVEEINVAVLTLSFLGDLHERLFIDGGSRFERYLEEHVRRRHLCGIGKGVGNEFVKSHGYP